MRKPIVFMQVTGRTSKHNIARVISATTSKRCQVFNVVNILMPSFCVSLLKLGMTTCGIVTTVVLTFQLISNILGCTSTSIALLTSLAILSHDTVLGHIGGVVFLSPFSLLSIAMFLLSSSLDSIVSVHALFALIFQSVRTRFSSMEVFRSCRLFNVATCADFRGGTLCRLSALAIFTNARFAVSSLIFLVVRAVRLTARSAWEATPNLDNISIIPFFITYKKVEMGTTP